MIVKKVVLIFLLLFVKNFMEAQNTTNDMESRQHILIKTKLGNLSFSKTCVENNSYYYKNSDCTIKVLDEELYEEAENRHIKKDVAYISFEIASDGSLINFKVARKGVLQSFNLLLEKFCHELKAESEKNKYKIRLNCKEESKIVTMSYYFNET